jgi:hypothetical protein
MSNPFSGFRGNNSTLLQSIWDKAWNDARARQQPLTAEEQAKVNVALQKMNKNNEEG